MPAFEVRLRRLLQVTLDNHILPVLCTQPVVFGPVIDDATGLDLGKMEATNKTNGAVGWQILELYNDVTRRVGAEEGILVIDEAREMPKSSRYYYDLMHFSNLGAAKFADIAARQLSPYLAQKFSAFAKVKPAGQAALNPVLSGQAR